MKGQRYNRHGYFFIFDSKAEFEMCWALSTKADAVIASELLTRDCAKTYQ